MFILLSFGIILFTIICLLNLRAGVFLIIFFLPLYLIRFNIWGAPTNVLDVLIFILFIVWVGGAIKFSILNSQMFKNLEIKNWKLEIIFPLFLILAGSFISMALNANKSKSLGIIKSWFIAPIIFFAILISSFNTERQRELVLSVLAASGVGVALLSLAYKILGIVTYDGRLQGIFNSPNYLAMYLAPCILIILYKIIKQFSIFNFQFSINDKIFNKKSCWFVSLVITLTAFFFTFSYSAWIALFIAGLVFWGLYTQQFSIFNFQFSINESISKFKIIKKLFILFFLLLFPLFIILYHAQNPQMANLIHSKRYSIESRLMIWRSVCRILKENPLWGIGLGNFQEEYLALAGNFKKPYLQWAVPHPHNIFLAFWLNCGLLGLIGFIWILISAFCHSREGGNLMGILLFSILLYILLHGLVDTTYFKNDLAVMFWIVIGLFHTSSHHID